MRMIYIRYHLDRFKRYLIKEEGLFKKQVKNYKLLEIISLTASVAFLILYVFVNKYNLYFGTVLFLCIALFTHIKRDIDKGYHVGWKRKKEKEKALMTELM